MLIYQDVNEGSPQTQQVLAYMSKCTRKTRTASYGNSKKLSESVNYTWSLVYSGQFESVRQQPLLKTWQWKFLETRDPTASRQFWFLWVTEDPHYFKIKDHLYSTLKFHSESRHYPFFSAAKREIGGNGRATSSTFTTFFFGPDRHSDFFAQWNPPSISVSDKRPFV